MPEEPMNLCQSCGATVYPEHIDAGIARYEAGRLLCSFCVGNPGSAPAAEPSEEDVLLLDPLMAETEPMKGPSASRVQAATSGPGHAKGWDESRFKKPLDPRSTGSTRCRIFHSKLNEGAVQFMNDAINDWLDHHPDVTVKFATSTIGVFEGKHSDPNLIITLFY